MSKPRAKIPQSDYEARHLRSIAYYERELETLYNQAISEAANLAASIGVDPSRVFSFSDYPAISARANTLLSNLSTNVIALAARRIDTAWLLSNEKNDALVTQVLGKLEVSAFMDRRDAARLAFQSRVTDGLNLSQRVFNYTGQFKTELELSIDSALSSGQSASSLARSVKQYLREPDKLFRRVRNNRGQLVLSQNARAFNPGAGIYRSSYKNALRLTATEINSAYRTADYERWQGLPFVVGIRLRRSSNRVPCILCDSLVGDYPKEYVFSGNHPSCRCYATPILATPDEVQALTMKLLAGSDLSGFTSANQVRAVNPGFTTWVEQNRGRWENGTGKTPLFIQQNRGFVG